MIINMFKEFRKWLDEPSEKLDIFNTVRKYKEQTEKKNIINKMKNTQEGINSRLNDTMEQIYKPEDRIVEISEAENKKKKKKK